MTNINYRDILTYLDEHKEKPFVNPDKPGISEETKKDSLLVKQLGEGVVAELIKIGRRCGALFGLKHVTAESWLDTSGTKTRKSLCVHMRYSACADSPISVAVVVEKNSSFSR